MPTVTRKLGTTLHKVMVTAMDLEQAEDEAIAQVQGAVTSTWRRVKCSGGVKLSNGRYQMLVEATDKRPELRLR